MKKICFKSGRLYWSVRLAVILENLFLLDVSEGSNVIRSIRGHTRNNPGTWGRKKSAHNCVSMQIRTDVLEVKKQITTQTLVCAKEIKNNMNGKLINDTSESWFMNLQILSHHFTKLMARTVENKTLHHQGYAEQKNCQFFGTAICRISQKDLY